MAGREYLPALRTEYNGRLIALIHSRPALWDTHAAAYKNNFRRCAEWQEVATLMKSTEKEVKWRWGNLRDAFVRKLREHKKKKNGADGARSEEVGGRWPHFSQMLFLQRVVDPRASFPESQDEYIVPTTSEPDAPSTAARSTAAPSSIVLSDIRSLATPPSSETSAVRTVEIKKEVVDYAADGVLFEQAPSSSSVRSTEPVLASAPALGVHAVPVYHSILPAVTLAVAENPMRTPISPPPTEMRHSEHRTVEQDATVPAPCTSSERPAPSPALATGRKRTWGSSRPSDRRARLELDVLVLQKKKARAELRKCEADERRAVTETLLIAEEMKRCDEKKRKLKAETEFLVQEKRRSEEDARKAEAIAEFHVEERRRSAAIAEYYAEEKRKAVAVAEYYAEEKRKAAAKADWFLEQQKTEVLRQRLLLLELRKLKKGSNVIE